MSFGIDLFYLLTHTSVLLVEKMNPKEIFLRIHFFLLKLLMLDPNLNYIAMQLNKWNPDKHDYEPFESPAKKLMLISRDMDERCDCANCGKDISFGESYTSRLIHTDMGFGYPVCSDCYKVECLSLK